MSARFIHAPVPEGTELRLAHDGTGVPVDLWAVQVPAELLPGVDLTQRLIAAGSAIAEGDLLLIEHTAVAGLTVREATSIGLPVPTELRAVIEGNGLLTKPDFKATLTWQRPTGQPVLGAQRVGAWLKIGSGYQRLPSSLFEIAEAVDRLAAVPADDVGGRLAAIAGLREVLPPAEAHGEATARGMLGRVTIVQADAFSLDLEGDGEAARLVPILHRCHDTGAAPLLPEDRQRRFGEDQFHRFGAARPVYTLGDNWMVVLAPPLRRALQEVRQVNTAPAATRRAFFSSPRAFLREALGDEVDFTVVESVFQETDAWSDRVIGLGLWEKRVLPWVPLPATEWFGPEGGGGPGRPAAPIGIIVGDRRIPLSVEQAVALQARIETAIGTGHPSVDWEVDGERVAIPADLNTLAALQKVENDATKRTPPETGREPDRLPEVVLIRPNETELEVEEDVAAVRRSPPFGLPRSLSTPPKPHQVEGLDWLQRAWARGLPGVLLADDMGLGKTLQGLAFLAWLREGMAAGTIDPGPLLIVAPTGLLENWRAEHDRHLVPPGLGPCLAAYGKGLAQLRKKDDDGRPGLDRDRLAAAAWVMTTYETLRDHDRDFARVRFAVLMFDEAQKIKTPGVRLTDAAKAMNAEFRIALTGTPVENRLADLWCIVDTVHPGCLDDLKSFSAKYEREPDAEKLTRLKATLDHGHGGRPPLLLRRLKEDRLPDLPPREDVVRSDTMSGAQLAAYDAVVHEARNAERRGAVLEALQGLRALCLHPRVDAHGDDDAFVTGSARLRMAFQALDAIAAAGERALIFLDDLDLQARLAGILQRRYRLPAPPMVINGQVDGRSRQGRVDRFQANGEGFDAMLLSPRAGGVGLTLTRANHVIHLSRWWNPAVEDQCTGRVLRIGQTKPVTVHIPIATLPEGRRSFDENLHALLERKRRLMKDALMPPVATDTDREALLAQTISGL